MFNRTGNEHDHPAFLAFAAKLFIDFLFRDRILIANSWLPIYRFERSSYPFGVISLIN